MFIYSRPLKLLVAGLYLTVVLAASLFHTHSDCAFHCQNGSSTCSSSHGDIHTDTHSCSRHLLHHAIVRTPPREVYGFSCRKIERSFGKQHIKRPTLPYLFLPGIKADRFRKHFRSDMVLRFAVNVSRSRKRLSFNSPLSPGSVALRLFLRRVYFPELRKNHAQSIRVRLGFALFLVQQDKLSLIASYTETLACSEMAQNRDDFHYQLIHLYFRSLRERNRCLLLSESSCYHRTGRGRRTRGRLPIASRRNGRPISISRRSIYPAGPSPTSPTGRHGRSRLCPGFYRKCTEYLQNARPDHTYGNG